MVLKEDRKDTSDVRRGGRRKQLLDDLQETQGCWKLNEDAFDRNLWRSGYGRGDGPVVRQITGR